MLASLLGWSLLAGFALVVLARPLRVLAGLVEWEGRGRRLTVGDPRAIATLGSIGVLALAFWGGGAGLAVLGGGAATGSTGSLAAPSPPNTPTIDVAVQDTSTWWVNFSTYVGSGDDAQDSISVTVLRSGAADTLFHAVSGVQTRDTISDNTDLKADTTYRVLGRQKGTDGGWSVADTLSVLNNASAPDSVYIHLDWDGSTGVTTALVMDSSKTPSFNYVEGLANQQGSTCPVFSTVSTSGAGRDFPTTNFLRFTSHHQDHDGCGNSTDTYAQIGFLAAADLIPTPDVGDSVFVRYYIRHYNPYWSTEDGTHGDEWKDWPFPYGVGYELNQTSGSGWQPTLHGFNSPSGKFCLGNGGTYLLSYSATYRFEHGVIRSDTSEYQVRIRIYDINGTLLYDHEDFTGNCWGGEISGTSVDDHSWASTSTTWDTYVRQFHLGINGIAGITTSNDEQDVVEWAGFAMCSGWCGPWPIPGVEN